jgi:hypothetical protein
MIVVTRKAVAECGGYTVWEPHQWHTPFFARGGFGSVKCRRAKLICRLPFGFGLFWTFGKGWIE